MGDPSCCDTSSQATELNDFGFTGYTKRADVINMATLYRELTPDQRSWRCEQTKKAYDFEEKAWELLLPISDGHWNRENAYMGLSFFVKAVYEGQGHPPLNKDVICKLSDLVQTFQDHMPYVSSFGRRVPADDSPARHALRVAFNSFSLMASVCSQQGTVNDGPEVVELLSTAMQMVASCIEKLGGPVTHEGTMTAEENSFLARLATAQGPAVEQLVGATPIHVMAIFMLQAVYDIDLRVVKWVLHYVAARCAKEIVTREWLKPAAKVNSRVCSAARTAWLSHARAMGKLDPKSPLAAFELAEERSVDGPSREALTLMRVAVAAAERRGDDILAWLARLNVAQLIIHGANGQTFLENEFLQEIDAAEVHKASAKRWGGHVLIEGLCSMLKESLDKVIQKAREKKQQLLKMATSESTSNGPTEDDGRLPSVTPSSHRWRVMASITAHNCASCKKMLYEAMACSRCKQVYYCGRDCQLTHWRAGHRKECAVLANAVATAATSDN